MASFSSRSSSVSCADSGISCTSNGYIPVNPRYACYWLPECVGNHEIDGCSPRIRDLRGKLGMYYSPNGMYKRFSIDRINNLSLQSNPTGCTMVSLLIYKKENNETWLLFAAKLLKVKSANKQDRQNRRLFLSLPSSNPRKKDEIQKDVAARALGSITNETEITKDLRARLKRFIFIDASVTYPLFLTDDQVNLLTRSFTPNEEVVSLHWFPLSMIMSRLPLWNDYIRQEAKENEIAQIRHSPHEETVLNAEDQDYTVWPIIQTSLMCIRNHVGFDEFLKV